MADEIIWREGENTWSSQVFDYGVKDAKGRTVGGAVHVELRVPSVTFRNEAGQWVTEPTGKPAFYYVTHSARRDGRHFGSSFPRGTRCSTLEEGKTVAGKKVQEARRRFQRAAAKGRRSPVRTHDGDPMRGLVHLGSNPSAPHCHGDSSNRRVFVRVTQDVRLITCKRCAVAAKNKDPQVAHKDI
jgi:hypothetical protein